MTFKPSFYDPAKVGTLFLPRLYKNPAGVGIVEQEADAMSIPASVTDKEKIALMIIDMQIDFCHKDGSLYVDGAEEDIRRAITFILTNMDRITTIFASLDTHLIFQIFYRSWWRTLKQQKPDIYSILEKKLMDKGDFQAIIDPVGSIEYEATLERNSQKKLMLWPYHTMLGTPGNAMDPSLFEILAFHAFARKSQLNFLQKGLIPQSEMYGILKPEVPIAKHKQGGFNTDFLNLLMKHDKVIIMGQAKSHCVLETELQIYDYFAVVVKDPDVLKKVFIFEDCMSSVKHPLVDFEAITQNEFKKFKKAGMNIMKSTDFQF